jgi:hypothetical protein
VRWIWNRYSVSSIPAMIPLAFCFFVIAMWSSSASAWAMELQMADMPQMNAPVYVNDGSRAAKLLADKEESEFNHHLAGLLVGFAGLLILAESTFAKSWRYSGYTWPVCFLAAGVFLLIFSDTEIWPFGPQTPWYAITHETEDLQHKVFATMLLIIGCVELQRARGHWKWRCAAWLFPIAGVIGGVLLLLHVHSGNMQAPHAMETMERIQKQHRLFATAGLGVAIAKGLAQTPQRAQIFFARLWPALLVILGVLLMRYTE